MATFDRRVVDEFPRLSSPSTKTNALGPLHSVYVPAMKGTKIALDVLFPQAPAGATFPTVLIMTRYWRNKLGEDPNPWHIYFAERGFVTIHGDVRGTGASFGQWPYHRSRSETHDFTPIMDWIVAQPWSDGRIVGTGTSYSGNTADWMAERNHPALKVIVPRYADYDPYADVYFPGGVPNSYMGRTWGLRVKDLDLNIKRDSEGNLAAGVRPVDGPEGKELLQAALMEHLRIPSVWDGIQEIKYRDDQPTSWHGASMTDFGISSHMEQVKKSGLPCQNWASWMDTCTANGAIHRFLKLGDSSHVIIGPWSHGGRHAVDPLDPERDVTAPNYAVQQAEVLLFIQESLEGKWKSKQKRLSYFTCGQQRWKTTTSWPPANTHFEDWYFSPNSNLAKDPSVAGVDTYVVDFDVGTGKTTRWATGQDSTPVHYSDRLEVDKRLLCYTSSPLPHDVEITGHPVLTMFLTSTETDGAFYRVSGTGCSRW